MCVAGEFGESERASTAPSSAPSLRLSCTLNSWSRVAEGLLREKKEHQRKAGGLRVLSPEQLCETVNLSAIFQRGWQR